MIGGEIAGRGRNYVQPQHLTCSACGETKPIGEFGIDRHKASGRKGKCRPCLRAYWLAWRRANAEKHREAVRAYRKRKPRGAREQDLSRKRLYGLQLGDADRLLAMQDGCCAICRAPIALNDDSGDALRRPSACIDHCHQTTTVRGVLCRKCNSGLGMFGDSPERLAAAAKYLRETARLFKTST